MQTSNFARSSKDPNAVAICRGIPCWYEGRRYPPLAPDWELIRMGDEQLFRKLYFEQVLSKMDPRQVCEDLGPDAVMLCWESPGKNTAIVAWWRNGWKKRWTSRFRKSSDFNRRQ
ncbi:MAG: hypothetical protein A4E72_00320 [Syntrophus sp. PtaU1.Bin208]|nr:MAG: hypothetical protein A4E72_00320 [Syntrophus sp. PtaU1.Bin208]